MLMAQLSQGETSSHSGFEECLFISGQPGVVRLCHSAVRCFELEKKTEVEHIFMLMLFNWFFLYAILMCCRDACPWARWSYKSSGLQTCLHCPRHNLEFEMAYLLLPKPSASLCCLPGPDCSMNLQ